MIYNQPLDTYEKKNPSANTFECFTKLKAATPKFLEFVAIRKQENLKLFLVFKFKNVANYVITKLLFNIDAFLYESGEVK